MTVHQVAKAGNDLTAMRRGACPTLGQPMPTGDGLLARLRVDDCRLTLAQLRAVADSAAAFGNGILEVTARGSLQVRGLDPETVDRFEAAVLAAGIVPSAGLMVEVTPLAGLDPTELIDPRPVADAIRRAIAAHAPALALAPKLAVTVDGGGHLHLGAVAADIRLTAVDAEHFLLATGGDNATAHKLARVSRADAPLAVLDLLEFLAALGPIARGKALTPETVGPRVMPAAAGVFAPAHRPSYLGIRRWAADGTVTLGLAFAYRQARASDLIAFLDAIEILGVCDVRLAPDHGLVLTGLHHAEAERAEAAALRHGFWTSDEEPRRHLALCAGNAGCASGGFDTRAVADQVARQAPSLLDGSLTLHLSGCRKGCAHPAAAPLALVGSSSGYDLVANGAASDAPALHIAANDLGIALGRLASLVANAKEAGESARDVLVGLGPAGLAAALTLDEQ